jgi:outer membrane protein assembly factor BamD
MGLAESAPRGYVRARPMRPVDVRFFLPRLMGRGLGLLLLSLVLVALSACEGPPVKAALGYTDSAKHAYDLAMEHFTAHEWIQAENAMREIKRKYSYSKYARLAELRLADADLLQEKYPEAIHGYKDFMHAHRADAEDIAYARGKIAEAMCAEIPDSALLPAQEERDQASVVDAYKELKSYLADYPEAKNTPHLRTLLSQVTARLVRHELYVARFYAHRDNFDAAIARVRYALANYAVGAGPHGSATESGDLEAEALLLLGETYMRVHKWADARTAFESILRSYSESSLAVPARNYLASMKGPGV